MPPIEATAEDVSVAYDGKAHGIAVAVTDPEDGYEVKYGESADACTLDASPTVTNVADGPKTVWYKVSAAGYADATGSAAVAVTKAPSSVKAAPEATNPTYTGAAQGLVTPGTAEGGTMRYSLDGASFSEKIPVGTEAKSYTVWYKVAGDPNHDDSEPKSVTSTITVKPDPKPEPQPDPKPEPQPDPKLDPKLDPKPDPDPAGADMFRLYNPYTGEHFYTAGDDGVPLFRQYNPNAVAGAHNYTTSEAERDMLVSVGWNDEGVGWYGL